MLLQVQALELPHLVLPLSLTILARCQPSKKIGFLSATEGKLPMCSHALAVVAVAMRLLYGLGNDEQETHEEHSKVIKLLHANRNRLVTDGWGFLTQMEISPSCSAVYASCETQQAQGSLETIHTRKRRRIRDVPVNLRRFDEYVAFCKEHLPLQLKEHGKFLPNGVANA